MRGVLPLGGRRLAWAAIVVGLAAAAYAQGVPGGGEPRVALRGVVVDTAGMPLPRVRMDARAGAAGTFSIGGLPPGEYWVAAVERIPGTPTSGAWQDPALLETLSARAIRATLGPSDVHPVPLRRIDSNLR
jgi:hypothetical protein